MFIPVLQHFQAWSYAPSKNTGKVHHLKKGFPYCLIAIKPELEQT